MGILNILFGSVESRAKKIMFDEEHIIRSWKAYYSTLYLKKDIIERITVLNCPEKILFLTDCVSLELVDIKDEEKSDDELLLDLLSISHEQKIKRINRLEQCLNYTHTKYEHLFKLLEELHSILKNEMHLTIRLGKFASLKWINLLKYQLELELLVVSKINLHESSYNLFISLVNGEHIISVMDEREKELLREMSDHLSKVFSNQITTGVTHDWALTVFNAIEDKVHEGVENNTFIGYHDNIDFEFVNRAEFVGLVKECIPSIDHPEISTPMINVFVHLFREWYNNCRD